MIADRGHPVQRATEMPGPRPARRSRNPDFAELVVDDPDVFLERGEVLFTEGDPPSSMYVVKSGVLQVRSGSVIYENVAPGAIVGEMALVEKHELRSATVYALTDSELVEISEARFAALIAQSPGFAIAVMQTLSRRLRVMDRRYHPQPQ